MVGNVRSSIRITVVSACVVASALTAAMAIGLQYYFSQALAKQAAVDLYTNVSSSVASELRNEARVNANVIELLAENPVLRETGASSKHLESFARVMERNPLYYGVYLGTGDGRFYELINLESSDLARSEAQALPLDRWLVISVEQGDAGWERHYSYLDHNLKERLRRSEPTDFDPRERPWYVSAINSDEIQYSDPYLFAQLGVPGRTLSRRVAEEDVVVAIDITLATMSRFLASQKISDLSTVYVYDDDGMIIASSRQHEAAETQTPATGWGGISGVSSQILLEMASNPALQDRLVAKNIAGEPHLVYSSTTSAMAETPLYVGIISPRDAVLAPFLDKVRLSILITSVLLLLLLPLSWLIANPIVKPVRQLARENEKVRRRDYHGVAKVSTRIKELDELSGSMLEMVDSIQAHELAQRKLMDSIIELIAQAIDEKSAYTGGHCERVPELALMLAAAASSSEDPAFSDFRLETDDQWHEFRIAAWLHDCGKITTPEHIVDKGSKLETIYNRIHEVRMRFEVLWRDAEIDYLTRLGESPEQRAKLDEVLHLRRQQLQDDFVFVAECNVGGEFLDQAKQDRLRQIGSTTWLRHFDDRQGLSPIEELRCTGPLPTLPAVEELLADKAEHIIPRTRSSEFPPSMGIQMEVPEHLYDQGELHNLSISRGTLTAEDRFRIQEHMISTIRMLDQLPFPEELKNVPRYASTHHETMDGRGYPRKLSSSELSIPERLLAVADVFEALTASDRPYKKAKTVSESVDILYNMVQNLHIDQASFELFISSGIYMEYARKFLDPTQVDEIHHQKYLP